MGAPEPPRDLAAGHYQQPGNRRQWLWGHIGRLSGIVLGIVAFAFLVLLAALGWPPASALVVVVVIGVAMIAIGGRIRGR